MWRYFSWYELNIKNYFFKGYSLHLLYNSKQKKIKELARDFAESEIAHDNEDGVITEDLVKKLAELNFFGIQMPEEYGGAGLDTISYAICIEELSRVSASVGLMISVHNSVAVYPIYVFGNDYQKKEFLIPLARGEKIGSFCLTEPNAGSDASNIETFATIADDGNYKVNGHKAFVTNGGIADILLIFVKTDLDDKKRGMSVLIAESDIKGFSRGEVEDLCGMRGNPVCSLLFTDAIIPASCLLGKEGDGFRIAMTALDTGRIGIAAQAIGIAQAAMEASIKYSKERIQFGKPLAAQQMIQSHIAEMGVNIEAARMLVFRAASLKDNNKPYTMYSSMAKYFASRIAMETTTLAIQIHGAYGYSKSYGVERFFRDAKITEIYEGASEIQKIVIAKSLLEKIESVDL
jgi:butyryl-CoA dehydrogenase